LSELICDIVRLLTPEPDVERLGFGKDIRRGVKLAGSKEKEVTEVLEGSGEIVLISRFVWVGRHQPASEAAAVAEGLCRRLRQGHGPVSHRLLEVAHSRLYHNVARPC
jgi:hypothetical protein